MRVTLRGGCLRNWCTALVLVQLHTNTSSNTNTHTNTSTNTVYRRVHHQSTNIVLPTTTHCVIRCYGYDHSLRWLLCVALLIAHTDQDACVCEKVAHTVTVQWNRKVLLGRSTVAPPTLVEGRPSVSALNANPAMQCNVSALNATPVHSMQCQCT